MLVDAVRLSGDASRMRAFLIFVAFLFLCGTTKATEYEKLTPEGQAAVDSAIEHFSLRVYKLCKSYGFQEGTPKYKDCVLCEVDHDIANKNASCASNPWCLEMQTKVCGQKLPNEQPPAPDPALDVSVEQYSSIFIEEANGTFGIHRLVFRSREKRIVIRAIRINGGACKPVQLQLPVTLEFDKRLIVSGFSPPACRPKAVDVYTDKGDVTAFLNLPDVTVNQFGRQ